jgi:hypothetical protein
MACAHSHGKNSYLCMVHLRTLSRSHGVGWLADKRMRNWKDRVKTVHGLCWGSIMQFAWKNWETPLKTSVKVVSWPRIESGTSQIHLTSWTTLFLPKVFDKYPIWFPAKCQTFPEAEVRVHSGRYEKFWDRTPCSTVNTNRCFVDRCPLHLRCPNVIINHATRRNMFLRV